MAKESSSITSLADAIDALLNAVRAYGRPPADYDPLSDPDGGARLYPTADDFAPLRKLHAQVIGLAAAAGLPAPPPLEAAGLPLYIRFPVEVLEPDKGSPGGHRRKVSAVYRMQWVPNSEAAENWQEQLQDLRTAAQAWQKGQVTQKRNTDTAKSTDRSPTSNAERLRFDPHTQTVTLDVEPATKSMTPEHTGFMKRFSKYALRQ